jgi:hypothetical protein
MKFRVFDTPVEIEATRANLNGDPLESITYTEARLKKAFPGFFFLFKRHYAFTYENGVSIVFKRNDDRIYSGKLEPGFEGIEFCPLGPKQNVVIHKVIKIEELES